MKNFNSIIVNEKSSFSTIIIFEQVLFFKTQ